MPTLDVDDPVPPNEAPVATTDEGRFWGPLDAGAQLRSTHAIHKYHVHGTDGVLGHVDDFIVDDQNWYIRYLVLNASNWWFGKLE